MSNVSDFLNRSMLYSKNMPLISFYPCNLLISEPICSVDVGGVDRKAELT